MDNLKSVFKIYVVSLADAVERRRDIEIQLNRCELPFEFVDAVDLRCAPEWRCAQLRVKEGYSNERRSLHRSELGCALSHRDVYARVVAEGIEFAVVLEDDALLHAGFSDFLNFVAAGDVFSRFDVMLLGYSKLLEQHACRFYIKEPIKRVCGSSGIDVGIAWRNWTSGTVAYVISRHGAKKMLEVPKLGLADDWRLYESQGVRIAHVRPLLCYEQFLKYESSIEAERMTLKNDRVDLKEILRLMRGFVRYMAMWVAR